MTTSKTPSKPTNSDVEARAILAELVKRQRAKDATRANYEPTIRERQQAESIRATWFPQQRAFFMSKHSRRVGFCTRRAGKTEGGSGYLLANLLDEPAAVQIYIAQTSKAARAVLWPKLKEYIDKYGLGKAAGGPLDANETYLWIRHTRGGGMIMLVGADKADEIEKLRGLKLRTVILDEAATYGSFFEALVVESLGPALRDLGGHLLMIGTAGRKKEGLFYEAAHELRKRKSNGLPVYELHKWSLVDNPYLPPEAKDFDLIIDEEGFSGYDDPRFMREYLGIWAIGEGERMFAYSPERNDYVGELPKGHEWRYLLGCDFGWSDETAVTVVAWAPTSKTVYFVESWSKRHTYADEVAAKIMEFRTKYGVRRYVGDTGGYGKAVAVQLLRDYGIHIEQADKRHKISFVDFMNSAFVRGDIKIKTGDKLGAQFLTVAWNEDRTDAGKHERDDLVFSSVYGWRAAKFSGAGKQTLVETDSKMDPVTAAVIAEKAAALAKRDNDDGEWFVSSRLSDVNRNISPAWRELFES